MDISPTPSSFAAGGLPERMNWLLESGQAKKSPTSTSPLSNSGSSTNNYCSINSNHASTERLRMPASTEMLRMHSSSIPQMAYLEPPQPRIQNDPVGVLSQSVHACTSTIFGLYGLEIWKLDSSGSLISIPIQSPNVMDIKRQSSGLFISRVTQEADYESSDFSSAARDAFERLTDTTRLDHIFQETTDPGVGLAGALWSEASTSNTIQHGVQSISESIHRRVGLLAGLHPTLSHENEDANVVLWREVDTLAEDPHQPYDERLQSFAKAGFKLAAGIPFDVRGFRGIVIFYANPHADARKLRNPDNSQLIQFAAQFIGAAAAIHLPIKTAILLKNRRPKKNWNKLRVKIMAVVRFRRPLVRRHGRSRSYESPTMRRVNSFHQGMRRAASLAMNREESFKLLSEASTRLRNDVQKSVVGVMEIIQKSVVDVQYASKAKGMKWWQKVKGGHASNSPSFNNIQCMWTFVGVWITHVILSWLDYFIISQTAGEYQLLMGPLGALTTLQFNLTAAPASQPRNAFFSQVIALSICHFLHQIQDLDLWHRCALAPAIVAATTARLGIIHPPAGATAVLFSYDIYRPEDMIIFLGGVAIAIFTAVVINNLSDKRQYPSGNWNLLHPHA